MRYFYNTLLLEIGLEKQLADIEHRIYVCNKWLNECEAPLLRRLSLKTEINILEDVVVALESDEDCFENFRLEMLNGVPGKYFDVSGTVLNVCSRWVALGILIDSPRYDEVQMGQSKYSLGCHIECYEGGNFNVYNVTRAVEELPDNEKNSSNSYRYSNDKYSVSTLMFSSLGKIKQRIIEAKLEFDEIDLSLPYRLHPQMSELMRCLDDERHQLLKILIQDNV